MSRHVTACFHGFIRCIGNRMDEPERARYRTTQMESIKFENLLTLEEREKLTQVSLVDESEVQYVKEGRLDRLAEDQLRKDRERDEQLRLEEERLKREEEAYYAAKKEAARRTKLNPFKETITSQPRPSTTNKSATSLKIEEEDEEFDLFLKTVTNSTNTSKTSSKLHSITSDDDDALSEEEEIDFGFWESASIPKANGVRTEGNFKEIDLNLL